MAPPEITFGAASPGDPVRVPPGKVSAAQWPDACGLLTDAEITSILPQAHDITRQPQRITFLPSLDFVDGQLVSGTSEDLPNGACRYRFTLPSKYDTKGNASLDISLPVIADAASVTAHYDKRKSSDADNPGFTDLGATWDAQGCFKTTLKVQCHNGRFYFDVSGGSTAVDDPMVWQDKVMSQVVRTLAAKTRS